MNRLPTILCRGRRDTRGEALPVAILFLGVLFTILLGVHVIVVALARTAIQGAADAGVSAAQAAGPGVDVGTGEAFRVTEGVLAARIAMAASKSSILETRPPVVIVEEDRGSVTVLIFAGTISPILGGVELEAQACGPLDDVPANQLTAADAWRC